ncbi:MAG: cytidine deaminase [Solirubrobacteraceae bacterium]
MRDYNAPVPDHAQQLLQAAQAVMARAYAPYSQFKVGAALLGADGAVHVGANVENASYSQAQCAEASAIGAMIAAGETHITAVAIVAEHLEHCPPCGACRQRLAEFADPETPVYLGRPGAEPQTTTIGELLPMAFEPSALKR